jgi:uncharacterized protein
MRRTFTKIAVLVGIFSWAVGAGASEERPAIVVTGNCFRSVTPDLIEVVVGVRSRNADAQKAVGAAAPTYDKLLKAMKNLKLKNAEFNTTDMGVNKISQWERDRQVDKGFEARYFFAVSTSETSRAGEIFKIAKDGGANEVNGPSFRLSKSLRQKEYESCLEEATGNARSKANVIAKAMGVEISGKGIVREEGAGTRPTGQPRFAEAMMMKDASGGAPEVESKKEDVEVTLNAAFFIK